MTYNTFSKRKQKAIDKTHDKLIDKHGEARPIAERKSEKKKEKSVVKTKAVERIQEFSRNALTFESRVTDKAMEKTL